MKRYSTTLFILVITTVLCLGQENDTYKYIWAQGGINLRERPAANSTILSKVPFGDSLIILNTTDIGLAYLLTKTGQDKRRLLLQSRWVKVLVNNISGYMIDGYLLDYPCPKKKESFVNYLDRMGIKDNTTDPESPFDLNFGIARFKCTQNKFPKGKKLRFRNENNPNEVYTDFISANSYYRGFSTSILVVFLDPFFNILNREGKKIKVSNSWRNYLDIWDDNVESLDFTFLDDGIVVMDYQSACY